VTGEIARRDNQRRVKLGLPNGGFSIFGNRHEQVGDGMIFSVALWDRWGGRMVGWWVNGSKP